MDEARKLLKDLAALDVEAWRAGRLSTEFYSIRRTVFIELAQGLGLDLEELVVPVETESPSRGIELRIGDLETD